MSTTNLISPVAERSGAVAEVPKPVAGGDSQAVRAAVQAPQASRSMRTEAVEKPDLTKAVQRLNDLVQNIRRELQFSIDDSTGRTVIRVLDSETDELIRQIPPEEILSLAQRFEESNDSGAILNITA